MYKKIVVLVNLFLVFLIMNSMVVMPYAEKNRLKNFQEKVKYQQQREESFFMSDGFQRIQDVAGVMTFAGDRSIEERGFIGRVAQSFIAAPMSAPMALGGYLSLSMDKTMLITEGFIISKIKRKPIKVLAAV